MRNLVCDETYVCIYISAYATLCLYLLHGSIKNAHMHVYTAADCHLNKININKQPSIWFNHFIKHYVNLKMAWHLFKLYTTFCFLLLQNWLEINHINCVHMYLCIHVCMPICLFYPLPVNSKQNLSLRPIRAQVELRKLVLEFLSLSSRECPNYKIITCSSKKSKITCT